MRGTQRFPLSISIRLLAVGLPSCRVKLCNVHQITKSIATILYFLTTKKKAIHSIKPMPTPKKKAFLH